MALATATRRRPPVGAHGAAQGRRRARLRLLHQLRQPQGARDGRDRPRQPAVLLARRSSARCASRARVEQVSDAESDAYFATRPLESRWSVLRLAAERRHREPRGARSRASSACARSLRRRRAAPRLVGRLPRRRRTSSSSGRAARTGCTTGSRTYAPLTGGVAQARAVGSVGRAQRSERRPLQPACTTPTPPEICYRQPPSQRRGAADPDSPGTASGAGDAHERIVRFRCVLSPSAASRLDAARAFALAFPPSQPLTIVAATRGAADDFARAIARRAPRDARPVALQPHAARGAHRGAAAGGPRHRAGQRAGARSGGGARGVRDGAARRASRFSRRWPARPAFRARWRAPSATCAWRSCRARTSPPRGERPANCRPGAPRAEADESSTRRTSPIARGCSRRRATAWRARRSWRIRWSCSTSSSASPVEEAFALALVAAAAHGRARHGAAAGRRARRALVRRPARRSRRCAPAGDADLGSIQTHLFCRRDAAAARERRLASSSSRRRARGASASRLPAGSCARRAAAWASTRWPSSCARRRTTSGCSSTRSSARTCPPASSAARGVRTRPAARSWRCSRARPRGCRPTASPSTCRSASSRPPSARRRRGCRRATSCSPPWPRATCPPRWTIRPEPPSSRPATISPPLPARCATPRRWERMLVEAAVIGGDPERWRGACAGLAAELQRAAARRRAGPTPTRR